MPKENRLGNWLKKATRIVGMDPKTFEQSWVIRISRIQIISSLILLLLLLFGLFYLLFSYSPLGTLLPAGSYDGSRAKIAEAYDKMEQLDNIVLQQTNYIENLQNILLGKLDIDSVYYATNLQRESSPAEIDTSRSIDEQALEEDVLARAQLQSESSNSNYRKDLFLLDPVTGEISQNFKEQTHHGVDIVAPKNTPILSIYKGNVVHAGYDEKDGYTLVINHPNGLTSIYKHCEKLLKDAGENVNAGDPIGIVGNTGERSTGPHLHFELWSSSGVLNPMDYFSFGR